MLAERSYPLLYLPLVCLLFLAAAPPLHARQAKPCEASDLDVTLTFGNYGRSAFMVRALTTNISQQECVLESGLVPDFFASGQDAPLGIAISLGPEKAQPTTLAPGNTAHQMLRWSTVPSSGSTCTTASVINLPVSDDSAHPVQIIAPSLLRPICSQVAVDPYSTGLTVGGDESVELESELNTPGSLNVSSGIYTYHPGESFVLHAEAAVPHDNPGFARPLPCPSFFIRQRASDGSTRFEEFPHNQYRCGMHVEPHSPPVLAASFDAVYPIRPKLPGETALQVFELYGRPTDARVRFVESNVLKLRIAAPADQASAPAATTYDGWKTAFTLTDTSFGRQSALLDQTTHLEWLRLSATRNKNQEWVDRNMNARKSLQGWRFATDDEVATFFRHFTGSPTGRSNDPTVVHELQRMMGGPLGHQASTAGQWDREFTNGRIAGFYAPASDFGPPSGARFQYHFAYIQEESSAENGPKAIADPHRTGWIDGDRTSPDTGFFLVREHE